MLDKLLGRRAAPPLDVEERAGYAEALIRATLESAEGGLDYSSTAAAEIAAGMIAQAFASAVVTPADNAATRNIGPEMLATIARAMILQGEVVYTIDVVRGEVVYHVGHSVDVIGGIAERSWIYEVTLSGPTETRTAVRRSAAVLHFRQSVDPFEPWRGRSPLERASVTTSFMARLENALRDEAGFGVSQIFAFPTSGGESNAQNLADADSELNKLAARLARSSRGRSTIMPSSQDGGYNHQSQSSPRGNDWKAQRAGPNPPAALDALRSNAQYSTIAASGIPPSLAAPGADAQGQRESWRRFMHGTIGPMARLVEAEFSRKLDVDVALDFTALQASDIQGRARALGSMVKAGVDVEVAMELAGLA